MNILLLTTFPLSLKDWDNAGILKREIDLYKRIASKNNVNYSILTYGDISDLKYLILSSLKFFIISALLSLDKLS